ncbi:imidazole glycerol phosphate synthase subunit HisF, partial [Pseudoalteromonas sp. S1610]|uniref:HisA/HisF-related TIM barrel protein n=1 Tax=Pseudoalteromonas sp. S1610 TaxID=579506 RepID=UPI0012825D09
NRLIHDGVCKAKDTEQLSKIRQLSDIPLISSGGAGSKQDFVDVFQQSEVDGALAASVFHKNVINIGELKQYLTDNQVAARLCN